MNENIIVGQHKFIVDPNYDDHETSLHLFNVNKVEKSFSQDKDKYIGKGGTGAGIIKNRYPEVQDFIKQNKVIHMGVKHIPMSLHSDEDRTNAKKFGYIN